MSIQPPAPRRETPVAPPEHSPAGAYADTLSPSLLRPDGAASYELKFQVTEAVAREVELWARRHLALDPHADAALGDAYRIHSLYLDTPALDVFRRSPGFARRKFRLRRYGSEHGIYLERKTRSGDKVRKRRCAIPETELPRLLEAAPDPAWGGSWFHRRILDRALRPACQISYERVAHVGTGSEGPLRLTLDRHIVGAPVSSWDVAEPRGGLALFPEVVILELKYRECVPSLFKQLVWEMNLVPQAASKYRRCVGAWALGRQDSEVG